MTQALSGPMKMTRLSTLLQAQMSIWQSVSPALTLHICLSHWLCDCHYWHLVLFWLNESSEDDQTLFTLGNWLSEELHAQHEWHQGPLICQLVLGSWDCWLHLAYTVQWFLALSMSMNISAEGSCFITSGGPPAKVLLRPELEAPKSSDPSGWDNQYPD